VKYAGLPWVWGFPWEIPIGMGMGRNGDCEQCSWAYGDHVGVFEWM